jgi:fluoride exporter
MLEFFCLYGFRRKDYGLKNYFLAGFGGGLGAMTRYWLSGFVYRFLPTSFPYGNLVVNILGCFVIGVLMSSMQERFLVAPSLRIFLTIGILGGFTTFSSFSYETVSLLRDGELLRGCINVCASVFGCMLATYCGILSGRLL